MPLRCRNAQRLMPPLRCVSGRRRAEMLPPCYTLSAPAIAITRCAAARHAAADAFSRRMPRDAARCQRC